MAARDVLAWFMRVSLNVLRGYMDWPLRAKMASLLVLASVVPFGIAAFTDIRQAREQLLASHTALLAARGDELLGKLDTFHRRYETAAGKCARLPDVVALLGARRDAGRLAQEALATLQVQPATDENVRGVALIDLSGTVTISTETTILGKDLSGRSDVRRALAGSKVISDVHLGDEDVAGEPTIAYFAPVHSDGAVLGLVVFWIRATSFWNLMSASDELAGPNSFAVLFDQQGVRIGHTYSGELVFHPAGPLDPATVDAMVRERRFGERTRELLTDIRSFPEQFDRARSAAPDSGLFRGFATVNGKGNYGVGRRLATVPWTVFYMIPEASLTSRIAAMTRQRTLLAGAFILIALLAGVVFAALLLEPIRSLSVATSSLATGDLTARVQEGRGDEIGQLAASFNSMAARIESQATELTGANRELEAFSYSVAHDLRAPLRGMSGFAQILLDEYGDKLDAEGQDCLREIHTNAAKMASLIDAMLSLSRVTRSELRPEQIDLTQVARSIAGRLAAADPDRRVEVVVADGLRARLDPQLAQTLVENLVGNAWKFTSKVSPARIEFGSTTRNGSPTYFVRDNGAGFDMVHAAKLFAPFQRLHTVSEFPGTGIGLATVQRIVHRHGGRIWAEGRVDEGATFLFTFPSHLQGDSR